MKTSNRTPLRRALAGLAIGALALVGLTGCMQMAIDFTVHSDDTLDASVVVALSDDLATMAGMTPDELWDQAGDDFTDEMPDGMTSERYSEGGFTGVRMRMARAPLGDAQALDDDLRITRVGDEFVFEGEMDLDTADLDGLPQGIIDQMDIRISITFPGQVTEHNGSLSGTTVTWTPSPGDIAVMYARGSANADGGGSAATGNGDDANGGHGDVDDATGSGGGVNPLIWIAIGLAVLALLGIIAALVLKGKADKPAPVQPGYPGGYPAAAPAPAPAPAQPGYPGAPAVTQPGYQAGSQVDAYGRPINPATGQAYDQPTAPVAPAPVAAAAPAAPVDLSALPAPGATPAAAAPVDLSALPAPVAAPATPPADQGVVGSVVPEVQAEAQVVPEAAEGLTE